jgi:glycosyl transferase family 25
MVDYESYKNFFKMAPENGTIGCFLSHEAAWKRFMESDNEFAVIFEDDAQFEPQQLANTIASLIEEKLLWDIVGLELNHHGSPVTVKELSCGKRLVAYLTNVKHSGAYMINRNAARLLWQKIYPIKMPIDHYFTRSWEFGLKFCGIEPRLVKQALGDSQIKSENLIRKKSVGIFIRNIAYNICTSVMHTAYNLCCYIYLRFKR